MSVSSPHDKSFLFLQGPHGPFYARLAAALRAKDAKVWRIGFNGGDWAFWSDKLSYVPFKGQHTEWAAFLHHQIVEKSITDIVIYNDTRPIHKTAVQLAEELGLGVHVFEEGYIRPYWVSYERGGSNGNSNLMTLSMRDIEKFMPPNAPEHKAPPAHWGDMRQHIYYGAVYHGFVALGRFAYPHFKGHRALGIGQEFLLYLKRLMRIPFMMVERYIKTRRLFKSKAAYHLVLLQLEHDAAFQMHSPFKSMPEFIELVINGFAAGAKGTDHLVFKNHPLETGQYPLNDLIAQKAAALGIKSRVHLLPGGKLAPLIARAKTAVTVNSTAAHQALWRGIPVKTFGAAIYNQAAFVSDQPLDQFFAAPKAPDIKGYAIFRKFLLSSSQFKGGFYAKKGRAALCETLPDAMLAPNDPYRQLIDKNA